MIFFDNCLVLVENCGIKGGCVELSYLRTKEVDFTITKVVLNLENAVIIGEDEHINIIEKAKKTVGEYLLVDEKVIEIYE